MTDDPRDGDGPTLETLAQVYDPDIARLARELATVKHILQLLLSRMVLNADPLTPEEIEQWVERLESQR